MQSCEILPKITDKMENAGFDDRDVMAIRAVALYEGVNANGALIERDDLEKAIPTFIGKPVRILFDGENPTGHGYDRETKTFSPLVANIGFIHWAYGVENEEKGRYEAIVEIVVWQKYFPEIATRLRELHREGDLKFSFEAERDFDITPEGYRRCYNILFTGIAIVQKPAFSEARSLMVAEILNKGGFDMEDIKKLLESIQEKVGAEIAEQFKENLGVLNDKISELEGKLETANTEVSDLKAELAERDGTIKELEADRDKYKDIVETAEKEKLGKERLEKLSKYGEVKKSAEELAEMEKSEFVDLLAEMVENYKPTEEIAEEEGAMGVPFEKTSKSKVDRKEKLLGFIEGLV